MDVVKQATCGTMEPKSAARVAGHSLRVLRHVKGHVKDDKKVLEGVYDARSLRVPWLLRHRSGASAARGAASAPRGSHSGSGVAKWFDRDAHAQSRMEWVDRRAVGGEGGRDALKNVCHGPCELWRRPFVSAVTSEEGSTLGRCMLQPMDDHITQRKIDVREQILDETNDEDRDIQARIAENEEKTEQMIVSPQVGRSSAAPRRPTGGVLSDTVRSASASHPSARWDSNVGSVRKRLDNLERGVRGDSLRRSQSWGTMPRSCNRSVRVYPNGSAILSCTWSRSSYAFVHKSVAKRYTCAMRRAQYTCRVRSVAVLKDARAARSPMGWLPKDGSGGFSHAFASLSGSSVPLGLPRQLVEVGTASLMQQYRFGRMIFGPQCGPAARPVGQAVPLGAFSCTPHMRRVHAFEQSARRTPCVAQVGNPDDLSPALFASTMRAVKQYLISDSVLGWTTPVAVVHKSYALNGACTPCGRFVATCHHDVIHVIDVEQLRQLSLKTWSVTFADDQRSTFLARSSAWVRAHAAKRLRGRSTIPTFSGRDVSLSPGGFFERAAREYAQNRDGGANESPSNMEQVHETSSEGDGAAALRFECDPEERIALNRSNLSWILPSREAHKKSVLRLQLLDVTVHNHIVWDSWQKLVSERERTKWRALMQGRPVPRSLPAYPVCILISGCTTGKCHVWDVYRGVRIPRSRPSSFQWILNMVLVNVERNVERHALPVTDCDFIQEVIRNTVVIFSWDKSETVSVHVVEVIVRYFAFDRIDQRLPTARMHEALVAKAKEVMAAEAPVGFVIHACIGRSFDVFYSVADDPYVLVRRMGGPVWSAPVSLCSQDARLVRNIWKNSFARVPVRVPVERDCANPCVADEVGTESKPVGIIQQILERGPLDEPASSSVSDIATLEEPRKADSVCVVVVKASPKGCEVWESLKRMMPSAVMDDHDVIISFNKGTAPLLRRGHGSDLVIDEHGATYYVPFEVRDLAQRVDAKRMRFRKRGIASLVPSDAACASAPVAQRVLDGLASGSGSICSDIGLPSSEQRAGGRVSRSKWFDSRQSVDIFGPPEFFSPASNPLTGAFDDSYSSSVTPSGAELSQVTTMPGSGPDIDTIMNRIRVYTDAATLELYDFALDGDGDQCGSLQKNSSLLPVSHLVGPSFVLGGDVSSQLVAFAMSAIDCLVDMRTQKPVRTLKGTSPNIYPYLDGVIGVYLVVLSLLPGPTFGTLIARRRLWGIRLHAASLDDYNYVEILSMRVHGANDMHGPDKPSSVGSGISLGLGARDMFSTVFADEKARGERVTMCGNDGEEFAQNLGRATGRGSSSSRFDSSSSQHRAMPCDWCRSHVTKDSVVQGGSNVRRTEILQERVLREETVAMVTISCAFHFWPDKAKRKKQERERVAQANERGSAANQSGPGQALRALIGTEGWREPGAQGDSGQLPSVRPALGAAGDGLEPSTEPRERRSDDDMRTTLRDDTRIVNSLPSRLDSSGVIPLSVGSDARAEGSARVPSQLSSADIDQRFQWDPNSVVAATGDVDSHVTDTEDDTGLFEPRSSGVQRAHVDGSRVAQGLRLDQERHRGDGMWYARSPRANITPSERYAWESPVHGRSDEDVLRTEGGEQAFYASRLFTVGATEQFASCASVFEQQFVAPLMLPTQSTGDLRERGSSRDSWRWRSRSGRGSRKDVGHSGRAPKQQCECWLKFGEEGRRTSGMPMVDRKTMVLPQAASFVLIRQHGERLVRRCHEEETPYQDFDDDPASPPQSMGAVGEGLLGAALIGTRSNSYSPEHELGTGSGAWGAYDAYSGEAASSYSAEAHKFQRRERRQVVDDVWEPFVRYRLAATHAVAYKDVDNQDASHANSLCEGSCLTCILVSGTVVHMF